MAMRKLATSDGVVLKLDEPVVLSNKSSEENMLMYPVLGGTLSMINEVRFTFYFTLSTRVLLPGNLTIRLYYGSSVIVLGGGALALLGNLTPKPFALRGSLCNKSDASHQFFEAELSQYSGSLTLAQPVLQQFLKPTENSLNDLNFRLTAQFSVADAQNVLTLERARAEMS